MKSGLVALWAVAPVPTSDPCTCRKLLNVKIIDDEEYEKNKTFTIVLEEPILLEVGQRHGELGAGLDLEPGAGLLAGWGHQQNCGFGIFCSLIYDFYFTSWP